MAWVRKPFSRSSSERPLVSGTARSTKISEPRLIAANSVNVQDDPIASTICGKTNEMPALTVQRTKTARPIARPRIASGEDLTQQQPDARTDEGLHERDEQHHAREDDIADQVRWRQKEDECEHDLGADDAAETDDQHRSSPDEAEQPDADDRHHETGDTDADRDDEGCLVSETG